MKLIAVSKAFATDEQSLAYLEANWRILASSGIRKGP